MAVDVVAVEWISIINSRLFLSPGHVNVDCRSCVDIFTARVVRMYRFWLVCMCVFPGAKN